MTRRQDALDLRPGCPGDRYHSVPPQEFLSSEPKWRRSASMERLASRLQWYETLIGHGIQADKWVFKRTGRRLLLHPLRRMCRSSSFNRVKHCEDLRYCRGKSVPATAAHRLGREALDEARGVTARSIQQLPCGKLELLGPQIRIRSRQNHQIAL